MADFGLKLSNQLFGCFFGGHAGNLLQLFKLFRFDLFDLLLDRIDALIKTAYLFTDGGNFLRLFLLLFLIHFITIIVNKPAELSRV